MKKLIIFILFIALCAVSKSQSNLPYKSLSAFSNDTTAFMIYNFMDRADAYIDKSIKDVKKDMEISIHHYHYITDSESGIIIGMYIYIYGIKRIANSDENNAPEISGLKIYWNKNKSNAEDKQIKAIRRKSKYWNKEIEDILKNFKIREISVMIEKKSKYYEKYKPKILKNMNDGSEFSPFIMGDLND
ncbi:MAG: hypothetical protein LBT43_21255 [Prevotella sp.]|nr:hypothetical protein [Prevotella sp.]